MVYYLRLEGVNLDNFVYDTNDLSTVRGGGLLMLRALDVAEEFLNGPPYNARRITKGASWGLFKVDLPEGDDSPEQEADRLRKCLLKKLTQHQTPITYDKGTTTTLTPWRYATFVVDLVPTGDMAEYTADRDKAAALNHWRQMQSPSLKPSQSGAPVSVNGRDRHVCDLDLVSPAASAIKEDDNEVVSAKVSERRLYGRNQKQRFYADQTNSWGCDLGDTDFVKDFAQLSRAYKQANVQAEDADTSGDASPHGGLDGKIAVIYLDGNNFGRISRDLCDSEEKQQSFDERVRPGQQQVLADLLNWIKGNPHWLHNGSIRLETLLWGGDEIIWVVPAWRGWWTLDFFFRQAGQHFPRFEGEPLTHAAGLVFCHHDAPIHRIKQVAMGLADLAKRKGKTLDPAHRNLCAYQVLESFDHAGADLDGFRRRRCPGGVSPRQLIVPGDAMGEVIKPLRELKDTDFSRRKLYQIVQALYEGREAEIEKLRRAAGFDRDPVKDPLAKLSPCFGHGPAGWLHLAELWDYIGIEGVDDHA